MRALRYSIVLALLLVIVILSRCKKDTSDPDVSGTLWNGATPYTFKIPEGFPTPNIPADNPMTVEGIKLGRFLFYDPRLSKDSSMSCGSCHHPRFAFADETPSSKGIHGDQTRRNSMPLFNLAWQQNFFWDGRVTSLEDQALLPVTDQLELDNSWETVVKRLEADSVYPAMFKAAFGPDAITKENAAKAIAQFERSIVSAGSEMDKVVRLKTKTAFDDARARQGMEFFETPVPAGADCFHCHGVQSTAYIMGSLGVLQFSNNGLDKPEDRLIDRGREEVTGNPDDRALFKIPSLRNIALSRPYMHDGSIPDLDSIVEFYNSGGDTTGNTDILLRHPGLGLERNWTIEQKESLLAFLRSLTDYDYISNPDYQDPFDN
ncbi:MAG TPA: cytochrome-c peroxidase [Cryomorphaceae bacterium]|nr:cytochrome-c peroxidase [Owenweeksia sp.]HAD97463.1 cytochrome-c peroxidase [Cryomorphaceae bacterium]